jgi:hypothetical protein
VTTLLWAHTALVTVFVALATWLAWVTWQDRPR